MGRRRVSAVSGFADFDPAGRRAPLDFAVTRAALRDIPAILRIQASAGRDANEAQLQRAIPASNGRVLVARLAGAPPANGDAATTIIGWSQSNYLATVLDAAPEGHYLAGVTVAPGWRRRGVAHELTARRLAWIAARADEAFFVVNPLNRASIALHQHWGFREVLRAPQLAGVTFTGGTGVLMRAQNNGTWTREPR